SCEHLHLGSCHVRLREPVRDPELAADRLRARELVARLVEAAEACVEVRAPEQRVGLDCGKAALTCPGELLVEEGEHVVHRSPPEEHRAAELIPGLDLAARVAGRERMPAAPLKRHELRAPIARGGPSGAASGPAEVCEQRCAFGGLDREEPTGPLEERGRDGKLVPVERASSRVSKQLTSLQSERACFGVDATKLSPVQVRLLEVVPHDFVLSRYLRTSVRFEPGGEPRMEVRAKLLRKGGICNVSDEHVVEAEGVVAFEQRAVGSEELLSGEGEEDAAQPVRGMWRKELRDSSAVEQPPLHRSALQHCALTWL